MGREEEKKVYFLATITHHFCIKQTFPRCHDFDQMGKLKLVMKREKKAKHQHRIKQVYFRRIKTKTKKTKIVVLLSYNHIWISRRKSIYV